MSVHAFQAWRRERDAVEEEMNRLIKTCPPASAAERQVRRFQFEALVERREAAARNLLQSDCGSRPSIAGGSIDGAGGRERS
jgi:hypothetical protein